MAERRAPLRAGSQCGLERGVCFVGEVARATGFRLSVPETSSQCDGRLECRQWSWFVGRGKSRQWSWFAGRRKSRRKSMLDLQYPFRTRSLLGARVETGLLGQPPRLDQRVRLEPRPRRRCPVRGRLDQPGHDLDVVAFQEFQQGLGQQVRVRIVDLVEELDPVRLPLAPPFALGPFPGLVLPALIEQASRELLGGEGLDRHGSSRVRWPGSLSHSVSLESGRDHWDSPPFSKWFWGR